MCCMRTQQNLASVLCKNLPGEARAPGARINKTRMKQGQAYLLAYPHAAIYCMLDEMSHA